MSNEPAAIPLAFPFRVIGQRSFEFASAALTRTREARQ
jgi:hypothetical protein